MKTKRIKKAGLYGAAIGAGLSVLGCQTGPPTITLIPGPGIHVGVSVPVGSNNVTPPPPAGYNSWDDYAAATGVNQNTDPNSINPPPPAGFNSWDDWAATQS